MPSTPGPTSRTMPAPSTPAGMGVGAAYAPSPDPNVPPAPRVRLWRGAGFPPRAFQADGRRPLEIGIYTFADVGTDPGSTSMSSRLPEGLIGDASLAAASRAGHDRSRHRGADRSLGHPGAVRARS